MSLLHTHVNVSHICAGALGGQKRVLDPLEPKLQIGVTTMWVPGCDLELIPVEKKGKKKQEHMDNTC